MLEVAWLLLDAPGVVHGGRDRAEDAHRGPHHQHAAEDAERHARQLHRVELVGDELELPREIPEHEPEHGCAIGIVARHARQNGEGQEEEGKERQQRVVGDGGGEGEVVAVVEADGAAPDGQRGQADLGDGACERPPQERQARRELGRPRGRHTHAVIISCPGSRLPAVEAAAHQSRAGRDRAR